MSSGRRRAGCGRTGFWLGLAPGPVLGQQAEPGQAGGDQRGKSLVEGGGMAEEVADAGVFACADTVLDARLGVVDGVDVSQLAAPAARAFGKLVGNTVGSGFDQAQLGAEVGALVAGEDAHRCWPGGTLISWASLA